MVSAIQTLKKEWHVIREAPFSFLIVCVIAIGVCTGGLKWLYKGKLTDSEARTRTWKEDAERWKADVDHYKDQLSQLSKEKCPEPPPSLKSKMQIGPAQRIPKPSVSQDCPQGICIGGDNSGNPTVNNFEPPARHIDNQQGLAIADAIISAPEGQRISVYPLNQPNSMDLGYEIYKAIAQKDTSRLVPSDPPSPRPVIGWNGPTPKGIALCVHDKNALTVPAALRIAGILSKTDDDAVLVCHDPVEVGEIKIVIGVNSRN